MMDKEKSLETLIEMFEAIEEYQHTIAKNGGSPLIYSLCKQRRYTSLTKDDLRSLKELDLSMLGIGCLLDEIGSLTNLESLDISGNYFKELPHTLWNLYDLKQLSLGSPVFGGNMIAEISPKIKNLQKLEYLDISLCNQLVSLPKELLELKNLAYLRLTQERLYNSEIVKNLKNTTQCQVIFEETLPPIEDRLRRA